MKTIDKQALKFINDFGKITALFDSMESVSVVFDTTNIDGDLAQYMARFHWDDDKKEWLLKLEPLT